MKAEGDAMIPPVDHLIADIDARLAVMQQELKNHIDSWRDESLDVPSPCYGHTPGPDEQCDVCGDILRDEDLLKACRLQLTQAEQQLAKVNDENEDLHQVAQGLKHYWHCSENRASGGGPFYCHRCWAEEERDRANKLQAQLTQVTQERDEARTFGEQAAKQYNELLEQAKVVSCAFCGEEYPRGTPRHGDGQLTEHIKVCSKHPLREAEAALQRVQQEPLDQPITVWGSFVLGGWRRVVKTRHELCEAIREGQLASPIAEVLAISGEVSFEEMGRRHESEDAREAQVRRLQTALEELDSAVCRVRRDVSPQLFAKIPEISKRGLDLALAHGRKALASSRPQEPTA